MSDKQLPLPFEGEIESNGRMGLKVRQTKEANWEQTEVDAYIAYVGNFVLKVIIFRNKYYAQLLIRSLNKNSFILADGSFDTFDTAKSACEEYLELYRI